MHSFRVVAYIYNAESPVRISGKSDREINKAMQKSMKRDPLKGSPMSHGSSAFPLTYFFIYKASISSTTLSPVAG
jgi:hypothetical protein